MPFLRYFTSKKHTDLKMVEIYFRYSKATHTHRPLKCCQKLHHILLLTFSIINKLSYTLRGSDIAYQRTILPLPPKSIFSGISRKHSFQCNTLCFPVGFVVKSNFIVDLDSSGSYIGNLWQVGIFLSPYPPFTDGLNPITGYKY